MGDACRAEDAPQETRSWAAGFRMICGVCIDAPPVAEGGSRPKPSRSGARKSCVTMMGAARSQGCASVLREVHGHLCVGGILGSAVSTNWYERGLCVGRIALGDGAVGPDECWSQLRGMQARSPMVPREVSGAMDGDFAACAVLQDRHFCILRDALGTRPLYYVAQRHRVAFSTDLRALMAIASPDGLVQSLPPGSFMSSSQPGVIHRWYDGSSAADARAQRAEQPAPALICRSLRARMGTPTFCVLLPNLEGLLLDDAVAQAVRSAGSPRQFVALCVGRGDLFEGPYAAKYLMDLQAPTAEIIDGVQEVRSLLSEETLRVLLGGPSASMDGMLGCLGVLWRCLLHVRGMAGGDAAMVLLPCASVNLGEPMGVRTPPPSICHYLCGVLGIMASTPLADLRFVEHLVRTRKGDSSDDAKRLLRRERGRSLQDASKQCADVLERCGAMEADHTGATQDQ